MAQSYSQFMRSSIVSRYNFPPPSHSPVGSPLDATNPLPAATFGNLHGFYSPSGVYTINGARWSIPRSSTNHSRVGPFRLQKLLGSGTSGSAFSTIDMSSGKVICAKLAFKSKISGYGREFFLNELKAYRTIAAAQENDRKWLMELHGAVQDENHIMLMMDFMSLDLHSIIRDGRLTSQVIPIYIAQIAMGLDALHRMGIMHCDIKPENILCSSGSKHIRISDFSHAWIANDHLILSGDRPSHALSYCFFYSHGITGTPGYQAPEMLCKMWYGPHIDWWALGAVAFELMTGQALIRTLEDNLRLNSAECYLLERAPWLSQEELSLLCGLLSVGPAARYKLEDLRRHSYFWAFDIDMFDWLQDKSLSSLRPVPAEVDLNDAEITSLPIFNAVPAPVRGKNLNDDRFDAFAFISPNGIWAS